MPKAISDQIVDRDTVVARMKDVIRSRAETDAGHLDDALVALTAAETAAIIGVRLETLARWRGQGRGPAFRRSGSCIRYTRASVKAWLAGGDEQAVIDR
jgi:Helix-turn-helix domain